MGDGWRRRGPALPTQLPPGLPAWALGFCHLWPEHSPQTRRCLKIDLSREEAGLGGVLLERGDTLTRNEEQRRAWGRLEAGDAGRDRD